MARRNFLFGVLVGVLLCWGTMTTVRVVDNFNRRLSAVEGYLEMLDHMLREASTDAPLANGAKKA